MRPSCARPSRLQARWRALGASAALVVIAAALTIGAPAARAASPCGTSGQFSQSGTTATCTYTSPGTEDAFTVPAGVSKLSVTAIGAPGGAGNAGCCGAPGGLGARVSNAALPVTPGAGLWVDVGGPGGNTLCPAARAPGGPFDGGTSGFCSGGGGASSALLTAARASAAVTGDVASDERLLVAGGGGGGGQTGGGGGGAGNPAVAGAGVGGCLFAIGGAGGVGPTDGTDGAGSGGCPGTGSIGAAGTAASGGGGAGTGAGGGGGGGGWFGGGGGGAGGGGGGGSSYGGAGPSGGISITTASPSEAAEVVISYTVSPPTASIIAPANGATYARGQAVTSSFSCAEGVGGPGIKSCLDQNQNPSGTAADTSTPGQHTFRVTATSDDGLTGRSSVSYTVLPPTRTPTAPTGRAMRLRAAGLSVFGRSESKARCRMPRGRIRWCSVRLWVGRRVLAHGRAASEAPGRRSLTVTLKLTRFGGTLLARHLGGVRTRIRARGATSGGSRRATAHTRAILRIEHFRTPEGSWAPGRASLTTRGRSFVRSLRGKLIGVASLRCDGHDANVRGATVTSSRLSRARAAAMCVALRRLGVRARPRLAGHGDSQPVASNTTSAGRATNRRVEVTITHRPRRP